MDTYGHLFTSQNREWVNKLDEPAKKPDEKRDGLTVTPGFSGLRTRLLKTSQMR